MAGQDSAQGFVLQNAIQFCYHYHHDPQRIQLNNCNFSAEKVDPDRNYAHGVVYSAWPLQGTAEFEVELTSVRNELSRNLKIGVMRCRGHLKDQHIPRYSSPELNYCMWCANNLHDSMVAMVRKPYGSVNLDNLKKGDRVGLRLNRNGTLQFLVNGVVQGTAAQNVYMKGWNVYVVIDHYGDCTGTRITRAVVEDLARDKIGRYNMMTCLKACYCALVFCVFVYVILCTCIKFSLHPTPNPMPVL